VSSAPAGLVATLLATRDLCGNEQEAAFQWFQDEALPFDVIVYKQAKAAAFVEWRAWQKAAGVPLKYRLG
jgi:hypothetical protein